MKAIKYKIALVLLLGIGSIKAQDMHFSQYMEVPTFINPALAGVNYNTRAIINYKTQWTSVGSKFLTYGFSFDQAIQHKKLKSSYFAVSASIFKDALGDAKMHNLNPNIGFSYVQQVSKKMKLSGGVQAGLNYRTIDINDLRFDRQYNGYNYDPNLSNGEPNLPKSSILAFDLGGGVNLNYSKADKYLSAKSNIKLNTGFSVFHFGMGRSSFISTSEKLLTKVSVYFNGEFAIPNSINAIIPTLIVMRQGPNMEILTGSMIKFFLGDASTHTTNKKSQALSFGTYYRYRDAIIPVALFQYNKYAFGFSYDINVSKLTPASRKLGGLEVMLRYNVAPGYGINLGRPDTKPSY